MTLTAAESLEIMQLITRADNCATARDANGYAQLFTEEGVMDGDKGHVAGRELAAAVARVWENEPPATLHLTCNAVVDDSASTPAVASILVMLIPQSAGGASGRRGRALHSYVRGLENQLPTDNQDPGSGTRSEHRSVNW